MLVNNVSIKGSSNVGGLLGEIYGGTVSNCSVTKGQVCSINYNAGGIVGSLSGKPILESLYANVSVIGDSKYVGGDGGIFGEYTTYNDNILTMNNVLFTGNVESESDTAGAIYGNIENDAKIGDTNTWLYDKNNIGLTNPESLARGTAKTADELKKASTYSGWDNNVWNILDGSYPTLK